MKVIKLYEGYKQYRGNILHAYVDEDYVEFENGLAVVKALFEAVKEGTNQIYRYKCYGVINEDFEEAFIGGTPSDKNLSFILFNDEILRCGPNDFLVRVRCGGEHSSYIENRHIRMIDGFLEVVDNNIPFYEKTYNREVIIVDNQLYNVVNQKFISRKYSSITPLPYESEYTFLVEDKIKSLRPDCRGVPTNDTTAVSDTLCFKINIEDELISPVYSKRWIEVIADSESDIDYDIIKTQWINQLYKMEDKQGQIMRLLKINHNDLNNDSMY